MESLKKLESNLTGFEKARSEFESFKILRYVRDPEYWNVYCLLIEFTGKRMKGYGLCIYDPNERGFIEEPGDLDCYNTTFFKALKRYSFTIVK